MSHFAVLVIGEDVEGQLAPYDENIEVEPYKAYWDSDTLKQWERVLSRPDRGREGDGLTPYPDELVLGDEYTLEQIADVYNARYHGGRAAPQSVLDDPDESGVAVDDGGIYEWSTRNPKSRWDGYQIGGRWQGYFKVKALAMAGTPGDNPGDNIDALAEEAERGYEVERLEGEPGRDVAELRRHTRADVLHKGMVDVDGMRDAAGEAAGKHWDAVQAVIGDMPKVHAWKDVLADFVNDDGEVDVEAARTFYGEQQAVKAMADHDARVGYDKALLPMFGDVGIEDLQVSAEEYIQRARDGAIAPYAYVYEGEWHAPGKMGWFGMSDDDEISRRTFEREFNEMFGALPDETLLTLVDCHI